MTADLAISLYEVAKSSIFATRRTNKGINGDPTSFAVASAQITKAIKNTANWNNTIGNTAKTCVEALETASKAKSLTGYLAKGLDIASGAVNPLIATTGVIKVACAKDKKTEAINQACALSGMFAAEKTVFRLLTPEGRALIQNTKIAQKGPVKSMLKAMNGLDRYATASKSSKFGKVAIPILKAATFVCASVSGYAIGAEIADKINNIRGIHPMTKNYEPVQHLSTKKDIIETDLKKEPLEYIS